MDSAEFHERCLEGYLNNCDPNNVTSGLSYILASVMMSKIEREREKNKKCFWVTINPKPGTSVQEFKYMVEKFLRRGTNKDAFYALEIRGKTEDKSGYYGLHAHMWFSHVDRKTTPGYIHRELMKLFKDKVGNNKHIDVRVYSASRREDKISYVKGEKWDEGKLTAVADTREWRRLNNIETIYYI